MQSTRSTMPSKKKKYNARFPAGRIKKIMQSDEDVGKIAHGVPVLISRSVELFVQSLLQQTASITRERNAKTLSQAHFKLCILRERKFDFLKDLVRNIEDVSPEEERKSSKSSLISPACSSAGFIPASECRQEGRRRKVKSETDSEDTSSSTRKDRSRKRRCSAFANNSANETSNLNLQLNIDHNNYYDTTETQSVHRNSCDLVIDEDCDT